MIRYALSCVAGHAFESWFASSGAFEAQARGGLLACPLCGSTQVAKQIMAPAVTSPPELSEAGVREVLKALHEHVKNNADDVGEAFAEEARRIHYGEAESRAIHGQASLDEAKELLEEGIPVLPLPDAPERKN